MNDTVELNWRTCWYQDRTCAWPSNATPVGQEGRSALLRSQYFHFFSWLLAGNSYMVTLWWCLTYTLIYLLVTRPPLTILTWLLESQWLFTNTYSFLAVTWTSWVSSTSPLLIVLHDSFLVMHYWSLYCSLWLRAVHYCTLLRTVTHCDAYCSRYSIVLLQYLSQAYRVLCSPRLDFFHRTVISTLVAANRLKIPSPPLPDPIQSYSLQRP